MLIVRALSFQGAGNDAHEARKKMADGVGGILASVRDGRALVTGPGNAYLCWHVVAGRGWLLDEVAAYPHGHGHGTRLLRAFLELADEAHAPVSLECPAGRIEWYRRHGFGLRVPGTDARSRWKLSMGIVDMRRPPRARRFNPADGFVRTRIVDRRTVSSSERVISLLPRTRQKAIATAVLASVVLVGTAGCGPQPNSPVFGRYAVQSTPHH